MFENWQDKLSKTGSSILGIAGGTVTGIVNPLLGSALGSTKTTVSTAAPKNESDNTIKIVVAVIAVAIIGSLIYLVVSNKTKAS